MDRRQTKILGTTSPGQVHGSSLPHCYVAQTSLWRWLVTGRRQMGKNSRRRPWQFGLGPLLLAIAVIAVLLGAVSYAITPFRGGQRASTNLLDCRSTRFTLYLTNKTDGNVCYHVFAAREVGLIDPPPAENWRVSIPPKGTVALSADQIFGYRRKGDEVCLSTWLVESTSAQPGVKQKESIRFQP